jgi:hypothetical protein
LAGSDIDGRCYVEEKKVYLLAEKGNPRITTQFLELRNHRNREVSSRATAILIMIVFT